MASNLSTAGPRPSVLRIKLESVHLSGTLNNFKNPQLVLKSQYGPTPRVPYTGSRTRTSELQHSLMIHVKDKADELVKLDLAAFVTPEGTHSNPSHWADCLTAECALVFHYPNGASKALRTLKVTFHGLCDVITVVSELSTLNIPMGGSPARQATLTSSQEEHSWSSARPHDPASRTYDAGNLLYNHSSSLPVPSSPTDWRAPYIANPAYHSTRSLVPSQLSSQSISQPMSWPSRSPVNLAPRPASSTGIPGILGEGLYKISRVSSAPGARSKSRRPSRLPEPPSPMFYTVSRHFDKTLERSDILRPTNRLLAPGSMGIDSDSLGDASEEPDAWQPRRGSMNRPIDPSPNQKSYLGNKHRLEYANTDDGPRKVLVRSGDVTLRPGTEPAEHSLENERASSDGQNAPAVVHAGSLRPSTTLSSKISLQRRHSGNQTSLRAAKATTLAGTRDAMLLGAVCLSHEGLLEATRIWDTLFEKGKSEAQPVDNLDEAVKIWSKYAGDWERQLKTLATRVSEKMRIEESANLC